MIYFLKKGIFKVGGWKIGLELKTEERSNDWGKNKSKVSGGTTHRESGGLTDGFF